MKLSNLVKVKTKKQKRVGRGESSGKGKTAGRGAKGQRKREKLPPLFEGGQLPIHRRLPKRRGLGNLRKRPAVTITTSLLNKLPKGTLVNTENLQKLGLLNKSLRKPAVKVVASGTLEKSLKVAVPTSDAAKKLIEEAGGVIHENTN